MQMYDQGAPPGTRGAPLGTPPEHGAPPGTRERAPGHGRRPLGIIRDPSIGDYYRYYYFYSIAITMATIISVTIVITITNILSHSFAS